MKNRYKKIIITIVFTLHAFTNDASEWPTKIKNGTFGLCNCNTSNVEQNIFELTLNSDSTFNYIDYSDSKNKLHVTGTWIVKGKKLNLISNDKKTKFHNKWKFDSKTQCIKSRLKLNFVRVCL
jgi:hypothetical protein